MTQKRVRGDRKEPLVVIPLRLAAEVAAPKAFATWVPRKERKKRSRG